MRNKLKSLLIWPPLTGRLEAQVNLITEPLGISYIAAVLESEGYEVRILDALALGSEQIEPLPDGIVRVGLTEEQIKAHISDYSPDIIGVSCMFSAQEADYLRVAKLAKEVCPKALVVCGGAHACVCPEALLGDKNVDIVVRGEGEATFLELVKRISETSDYTTVNGTVVRGADGSLLFNPPRELMKELDKLPFPARHLLPMERYFEFQKKGRVMYRYYMRKPIANIVTSRGCPYNCVFCAVHQVWSRGWRGRSSQSIIQELKFLTKKYGIREFTPWDDNIGYDRQRLEQICDGLREAGLNLTWATPNGIYLWNLDEPILRKMRKSGYYRGTFGLESGDPRTLKFIGKPSKLEKAKRLIAVCDRVGIWTHSSFMIGFPDEDFESINKTLNAPSELGLDFAAFFVAQPYIGTRLRTIFEKEGLLNPGVLEASWTMFPSYDTKHFTAQELRQFQQLAYKRFIRGRIIRAFNPFNIGQIIFKINSPERFWYFLRLISNLFLGVWVGRVAALTFSERVARRWSHLIGKFSLRGLLFGARR